MGKKSTREKDFRGVLKALEVGLILASGIITISSTPWGQLWR